jgi:phospholipase D-like protein
VDFGLILAIAIPLIAIQLALIVLALRDLTQPDRRVRGNSKLLWGVIIVFGELLGPLLYFAVGREPE